MDIIWNFSFIDLGFCSNLHNKAWYSSNWCSVCNKKVDKPRPQWPCWSQTTTDWRNRIYTNDRLIWFSNILYGYYFFTLSMPFKNIRSSWTKIRSQILMVILLLHTTDKVKIAKAFKAIQVMLWPMLLLLLLVPLSCSFKRKPFFIWVSNGWLFEEEHWPGRP